MTLNEVHGIFNEMDATRICPKEEMNLYEMQAYVRGYSDAKNALYEAIRKVYERTKTD